MVQYTFVSGIWIAHLAWMLNNIEWFFRNATERGFNFHLLNFQERSTGSCSNEAHEMWHSTKEPKITRVNRLHWGVQLCYKQADPACSQAEAQPSLSGGQQTVMQHQPLLYKKSHLGKIILEICEKEKGKKAIGLNSCPLVLASRVTYWRMRASYSLFSWKNS